MRLRNIFAILIFTLLVNGTQVAAETQPSVESLEPISQCAELLKDCFGFSDAERSQCFFSSARHPFCEGSELGKLTYKRWSMSQNKIGGEDAPAAFLGPQVVDGDCVQNFDNQWSSAILKGEVSSETLTTLSARLEACKKDTSLELLRP